MDPAQIAALFGGEEEAGGDQVALTNALRGGQDMRGQEQMGMLGLLTGDKVLGGVGNALLSGAVKGHARQETLRQFALQKTLAAAAAARERENKLTDTTAANKEWDRRHGQEQEAKTTEKLVERAEGLRKELMGNPITRQYQDIDTTYQKILGAAAKPSAAGDMAVVFSFMKMMDPGSAVKQDEYANAQNAAGVPERVRNQWNNLVKGELLNPIQRADFLRQAKGFHQTHANQYRGLVGKFKAYAKRVGVSPDDVSFGLDEGGGQESQSGATTGNFSLEDAPGGGGKPSPPEGMYTADDEARYQALVKKRKALE